MAHKDYFPDFIEHFDDIDGLDIVDFFLEEDIEISGYFKKSPFKERFEIEFGIPSNLKPYRAHWMITDNQLKVLRVNGIINNVVKNTDFFLPEYPDVDEEGYGVIYHYTLFSGDLIIINQKYKVSPIFEPYKINENEYLFSFVEGNLIVKHT